MLGANEGAREAAAQPGSSGRTPSSRSAVGAAWLKWPAARAAGLYLILASLWIVASDQLLTLVVGDPALIAKIGMSKGLAFVVVTTILLYILLVAWGNRADSGHPASAAAPAALGQRRLIGIFLGLVLLVPLVGYGIIQLQGPRIEQAALNDLRAIGDLKAGQVQSWLYEWRADADALVSSVGFVESLDQWRRTNNATAKTNFLKVLRSLEHAHRFEVELLDVNGRRMLADDKRPDTAGPLRQELLTAALQSGKVQVSDLYRDGAGHIQLELVVPLILGEIQASRAVGLAVIHAPVEQFLFPLIQTWPTPSPSGETLLVRREGNDVLFLTELRHRQGPALSLRLPIDAHPKLPAAIGLLSQTAVVVSDGIDYRGVPVLAAVHPIGGTPWRLVTKLDRDEVLTPLKDLTRWISLLALLAVAAVAVAINMLWRQQQRNNRLELVAQANEKDKLLNLFYDLPFMGMSMTSPTSKRFLYANDRLCEMLGYPPEELLDRTWGDIVHADDLGAVMAEFERLLTGESQAFQMETRYLRKDGRCGIGEINVRVARRPDGSADVVVAVVQDVTERKQAEERTRQAATVFESTRDGVMIAGLDARLMAVNKAFTDITGYTEAEALGQKPNLQRSGRHDPEFYKDLWASLLTTGQWQGDIWNRRKTGELYPAWITITTVCDERDQPTHYVGVFTDLSQLKRSEEQLAHLAHYDPLTNLPNRLLLQSRLAHALERAERHGQRAALLFINLDRFKTVNDSLGHLVGDQLLVDVGKRLGQRVRDEDTLGRFGGDEFLLVLESINNPEAAAAVARELLEVLATPFQLIGGNEVYIFASIGISVFPEDSFTASDLLRDADAAMHQAKAHGRNRFCFYTADMNANALAQLELEAALRRALERNEFVLHYQPKADLRSGQVTGAEALIRWQREGLGLQAPALFIPLAEKTGLIVPIGTWVIDAACRQLRSWRDAGWPDLTLAVNVSARQFHSGDLVEIVTQSLARHDVPPDCLELEVTESMLMENPEQTVAILGALKRTGVKLALDDFGTGYSSLAYLSRFPIDTLKIDQSFVQNIVTEPEAAMIAVSIIDLAHRMRLKVVAEGVETESQLGYLTMRDCDEMQGYYFARPMPAESFGNLLREGKCLPIRPTEEDADRTLLLVDDEPSILSSLRRLLRPEGYHILTANSGQEGLELLATHPVQVILSDQRMPQMTGTDFLGRVKDIYPNTVRIVLSGYTDLESVTQAVNQGAIYKFLYKPWEDDRLCEQIREAFLFYEHVIKPRAAKRQD